MIRILSEPEYIGRIPIRSEVEALPRTGRVGPSLGEAEFAEHGSIALRVPAPIDPSAAPDSNLVDASWTLQRGGHVLIRGREGGFYMAALEQDRKGWFVRVDVRRHPGNGIERLHRLDVTFDSGRRCWVVRELV